MGIDFSSSLWSLPKWFEENADGWLLLILIFAVAELINVILSTIKSVLTIKGTKGTATVVNTIAYSINAFIMALIGSVLKNVPLTVIITAITNAIGVWVGLTIIEKFRKERVWKISATVRSDKWDELVADLIRYEIKFVPIETSWDKRRPFDVYSECKEESKLIGVVFKKYNVKYMILESHNSL